MIRRENWMQRHVAGGLYFARLVGFSRQCAMIRRENWMQRHVVGDLYLQGWLDSAGNA